MALRIGNRLKRRPIARRSPGTASNGRFRARLAFRGLLLLCLGCVAATASAQISREYQLKAAFLFHFAQFTEWPTNVRDVTSPVITNAFAGTTATNITSATNQVAPTNPGALSTSALVVVTNEPLVIGVLGVDPFGTALDEIVRGERVRGRPLVVERYRRIEEANSCHIIFIAESESRRLDAILNELKGRPVLTVSDIEGAAYRGVMILLLTDENRIRLRINPAAVSHSGLTLSSKLLRAADLVSSPLYP